MDELNTETLATDLKKLKEMLDEYVLAQQGNRVTKKRRFLASCKAIQKGLDHADARLEEMEPAVASLYLSMGRQLAEVEAVFEMVNIEMAQKEEVGIQLKSLSKILENLGDEPNAESKQKARAQMNTINKDVAQYMDVDRANVEKCLKSIARINTALFEDSVLADASFFAAPRALSDSTHIARAQQHNRVETKTLPIFSGKIESYASFKKAFIARM